MKKLVYGVGINDGSRVSVVNRRAVKEYSLWMTMLQRCYSEKVHEKLPTYKNCCVSENFKSYSYFYDWCHRQVGFGVDGYELDKDLISRWNKIYSEDNCVFIPKKINRTLKDSRSKRGDLPIGVTRRESGKYRAMTTINRKRVSFGTFKTVDEAFRAYKINMEEHMKSLGLMFKDVIDERAYEALMNYTIDITD